MNIEIIQEPLTLHIHGFSGAALNKDYAGTAFKLSGRMWEIVRTKNLLNKGLNIWVYEPGEMVFAGVELDNTAEPGTGLELKTITISKYAFYKHIGPYSLLKQVGLTM